MSAPGGHHPAAESSRCSQARATIQSRFTVAIDAVPVSADRTALFLRVEYEPPLGLVGGALDGLGPHRLFAMALEDWFDEVAGRVIGAARYARPS